MIGPRIRAKVARGITKLPRTPLAQVANANLRPINEIYREQSELPAELKAPADLGASLRS
jgi:hypothetical protein